MGNIDKSILNKKIRPFSVIFDCTYPTSVKNAIITFTTSPERSDCYTFLDCGKDATAVTAIDTRESGGCSL